MTIRTYNTSMEKLKNQDLMNILNLIHTCNYYRDVDALREHVLGVLQKVLNTEAAVFFLGDRKCSGIDIKNAKNVASLGIDRSYLNQFPEYRRIDPLVSAVYSSSADTSKVDDIMPYSQWKNHPFYCDFCRPQKIYHKMAIRLRIGSEIYGVISVTRPEEQPNFSQREELICRILAPPLAIALRNTRLYSGIEAYRNLAFSVSDLTPEGILVLDHKLQVVNYSTKAMECCLLLSLKRSDRPNGTEDNDIPIPTEILQDCLTLKQLLENGRDIMPAYLQRLICTDKQKCIRIRSSITRQHLGTESPYHFLVSFVYLAEIRELAKEVMGVRFKLTERETEITECVYRGLSNAEISRELFISRNTVETHLKSIFQKTEVKSRAGLTTLIQFN